MLVKIYSLNDPITNEVRYIGRTTKKLNERLSDHISTSDSNHNSYKKNWIKKLKKLGLTPEIFLIQEVNCSWEESHIIEINIIKEHFEKGCKLVNLIDKGCGTYGIKITRSYMWKPILQYDLDGNFIKEYDSMTLASKELNINTKLIFKALKNISIQSKGFRWQYKLNEKYPLKIESLKELKGKGRRKKVLQYDRNGNFIRIFNSYREAALNINAKSESNIAEAIAKKYIFKNYQWRQYEDNYPLKIEEYCKNIIRVGKAVIAINNKNEILNFKSFSAAARVFKVSSPTIKNWCKTNAFKCEYIWYFN